MKIAWIFPVKKRCGISIYSHYYVKTLEKLIDIDIFDTEQCLNAIKKYSSILNQYDIIHIQYETSFFLKKNSKKYRNLCRQISNPVIVSLHEVYDTFPGIFPKTSLKGRGIVHKVREIIYDIRHPYQTVYTQHSAHNFYADLLIAHLRQHKTILTQNGIKENKIQIIPLPVNILKSINFPCFMDQGVINLGSSGFISANYNHSLLFDILDSLKSQWRFTWIGGIRRDEDNQILEYINQEIRKRNWQDKFIVTGWLEDEKRDILLEKIDIYLALFSARSSSASLAAALGARRLVIATPLPLTREMTEEEKMMCIVPADKNAVIENIELLVSDKQLRQKYLSELEIYIGKYSYKAMSQKLVEIYKGLIV